MNNINLNKLKQDGDKLLLSKSVFERGLGKKILSAYDFIQKLISNGVNPNNLFTNQYLTDKNFTLFLKNSSTNNRYHKILRYDDNMLQKALFFTKGNKVKNVNEQERVTGVNTSDEIESTQFKKSDISNKIKFDFENYVLNTLYDNYKKTYQKDDSSILSDDFSSYCLSVMEEGILNGNFESYKDNKQILNEYNNHATEIDAILDEYEFFSAKKLNTYDSLINLIVESFEFVFIKATNNIYNYTLSKYKQK